MPPNAAIGWGNWIELGPAAPRLGRLPRWWRTSRTGSNGPARARTDGQAQLKKSQLSPCGFWLVGWGYGGLILGC